MYLLQSNPISSTPYHYPRFTHPKQNTKNESDERCYNTEKLTITQTARRARSGSGVAQFHIIDNNKNTTTTTTPPK
jgi:hypothetical protein